MPEFYDYLYDDPYANMTTFAPTMSDDDIIASVRDWDLTSDTSGFAAGNRTVDNPQGTSFLGGLNAGQIGALLAGLGTAGLGVAGIGQSLFGDDKTATSNVTRSIPAMGAEEQGALTGALGLLGDARGVLASRAGGESALYNQALGAYGQTGTSLANLQAMLGPLMGNVPQLAGQQQGLFGQMARTARGLDDPNATFAAASGARGVSRDEMVRGIALMNRIGLNPENPDWGGAAFNSLSPDDQAFVQRAYQEGLRPGMPLPTLQSSMRDSVAGLAPQAMGQVPGLLNRQQALTDPSAQYRADPALLNALNTQAMGAAQGNLPALNDTLRGQIGRVYEGRLQDVNRYVDSGLMDALERARAQGFHGGAEVFREGAPGALVDRTMAEAVRQRGTLAGLQAQDELSLAQALPLLGANLATQGANIGFSGNAQNRALAELLGGMTNQRLAIPQLASGLETQRVGTEAAKLGALGGAAGAYNTPLSIGVQGGSNLVNLNQQLAESLGGFANVGQSQRQGLIGAATGAGNVLQQGRLAGAGSSQTTSQPSSLLDAFAPTASLLGGVGGLLSGIGNMNRPASSGMFRINPDGTLGFGSNI